MRICLEVLDILTLMASGGIRQGDHPRHPACVPRGGGGGGLLLGGIQKGEPTVFGIGCRCFMATCANETTSIATTERRATVFISDDTSTLIYAPEDDSEDFDAFLTLRQRIKWILFAIFFVTIPFIVFVLICTGSVQSYIDSIGHHRSGTFVR